MTAAGGAAFPHAEGRRSISDSEQQVLRKDEHGRRETQGTILLEAGGSYPVRIEYVHHDGPASQHVYWSGPGLNKRVLELGGRS